MCSLVASWHCQWDKPCSGRLQTGLCIPVEAFVSYILCFFFVVVLFLPLLGEPELFQWQLCWLEVVGCTCPGHMHSGTGNSGSFVQKSPQYFNFPLTEKSDIYLHFMISSREFFEKQWKSMRMNKYLICFDCMSVEFSRTTKDQPHNSQMVQVPRASELLLDL